MRASCEACGGYQPPDWKPGDLCVHCGKVARRESRCFWCAKWTPEGKFCRHCGASVVSDELYGAARMLKDAGTDRFTVPKLLLELDPDQIENFGRIYQRQAAMVARHVDDLLFLERFTSLRGFASSLEDRLIPSLPWGDEDLARHTIPSLPLLDDRGTARFIHGHTPFPETRVLAAVVCVRLDDWQMWDSAREGLYSSDELLREETVLALTGWRTLYGIELDSRRDLYEALSGLPLTPAVGVRLALLGSSSVERSWLGDNDPETSFMAALALGEIDRLRAALDGDDLTRLAASLKLAQLDVYVPLGPILSKLSAGSLYTLLRTMAYGRNKAAAPALRDALYWVLEHSEDDRTRDAAAHLLCREGPDVDGARIARLAKGSSRIFQSLLQSPVEPVSVLDFLLAEGRFEMSQYGFSDAAKRVPDDFVPPRFGQFPEAQKELIAFAEAQLLERGDEGLHKWMLNVALGPYPSSVRVEAVTSLHRWYSRQAAGNRGPLQISPEPVERYFGSMRVFLERLIEVLKDTETLSELFYYEFIAHLLKYHDEASLPLLVAEPRLSLKLRDQALLVMRNGDVRWDVRTACADLLGLLALHDEWLVDIARSLREFEGTEMEGAATIVLDRITRPYEDLGEGEGRESSIILFDRPGT